MKKIEGRKSLKGKQVLRKNRDREHRDKKYIVTESDMKFFAKMQSASGINKALAALDGIEKLNDAKDLEEKER